MRRCHEVRLLCAKTSIILRGPKGDICFGCCNASTQPPHSPSPGLPQQVLAMPQRCADNADKPGGKGMKEGTNTWATERQRERENGGCSHKLVSSTCFPPGHPAWPPVALLTYANSQYPVLSCWPFCSGWLGLSLIKWPAA